jgi:hypothetical protein
MISTFQVKKNKIPARLYIIEKGFAGRHPGSRH